MIGRVAAVSGPRQTSDQRSVRRRLSGLTLTASLATGLLLGCNWTNRGRPPPESSMFFPAGIALDPDHFQGIGPSCTTDAECGDANDGWACVNDTCRQSSRWLFVANANGDRRFNAGSLMIFDLEDFLTAATDPDQLIGPGESLSSQKPCRRAKGEPQVIECAERFFAQAEARAHIGDFASVLRAYNPVPNDGESMLLLPVRGDRALNWFRVTTTQDSASIECGQGDDSTIDERRCSEDFILRYRRNDEDLREIAREGFYLQVSAESKQPYAWLSHLSFADVTLVDLDGLDGGDGRPVIVDQSPHFFLSGSAVRLGGYGIAERPCDPAAAPKISEECVTENGIVTCEACKRPVVYGAFRFARLLNQMVTFGLDPNVLDDTFAETCLDANNIGVPGGVSCDARNSLVTRVVPGGLPLTGDSRVPVLAEIAFSRTGDELYVVQTNPGALVRVDTSVDDEGNTVDLPAGEIEVCSRPGTVTLYEDGDARIAAVSCYQSGQIYMIDLNAFKVAAVVQAGIGPSQMIVDYAREYIYVSNYLDATISVIDLSTKRPTRFAEVARLGLQEPYSS